MNQAVERSIQIANELVAEVGSQVALASLVGVSQPSVNRWLKVGLSRERENDLRVLLPRLKVWKRFPPERQIKLKVR